MTEHEPAGMRYETWVDRQIREASERGAFDDLPGTGKPLPGGDRPYDEHWWLRDHLRREGLSAVAALPTPLRLRKEIEQLPETLAELRSERAVREAVAELNGRVADWLRAPSGPHVPVRPVDADAALAAWRARRARSTAGPGTAGAEPPPARRRGWWHRPPHGRSAPPSEGTGRDV